MKKIEVSDFTALKYLGNLQVNNAQEKLAYVCGGSSVETNEYHSQIKVLDLLTNEVLDLTTFNSESQYCWYDDQSIIFSGCRDEKVKEKKKDGVEETIIYRISINGGEAQELGHLPLNINSLHLINESLLLVSGNVDHDLAYYQCDNDSKIKAYQERLQLKKDYEVFDEAPFWMNGAGITNGIRKQYFLVNLKDFSFYPVTKSEDRCELADYDENDLYFITQNFGKLRRVANGLIKYNLKKKKTTQLVKDGTYRIDQALLLNKDLLVWASDKKEYGLHEHASVYEYKANKLVKLFHIDNSYGGYLGSDALMYFSNPFKKANQAIYFVVVEDHESFFYVISSKKELQKIAGPLGQIDDFVFAKNELYYLQSTKELAQEIYNQENIAITHYNDEFFHSKVVSPFETITFKAGEYTTSGFVMKPVNYNPKKKYPGILMIHGGPKGVTGPIFDHASQVLAANGYFVFITNPRGSDGRGNKYADIRGRFGKEDYQDLMTFTDEVLKHYPAIDSKRLGVTGSSYGGYMTNWIITQTNRFQTAIAEASISNYITKFLLTDIGFTYNTDNQGASIWQDLDLVWEQSPLKYANQVTTPTLFIQSDQDYRCHMAEAIQMYTALQIHQVETKFVMFHNENHGLPLFGTPKHRVMRLELILDWFDEHLK